MNRFPGALFGGIPGAASIRHRASSAARLGVLELLGARGPGDVGGLILALVGPVALLQAALADLVATALIPRRPALRGSARAGIVTLSCQTAKNERVASCSAGTARSSGSGDGRPYPGQAPDHVHAATADQPHREACRWGHATTAQPGPRGAAIAAYGCAGASLCGCGDAATPRATHLCKASAWSRDSRRVLPAWSGLLQVRVRDRPRLPRWVLAPGLLLTHATVLHMLSSVPCASSVPHSDFTAPCWASLAAASAT